MRRCEFVRMDAFEFLEKCKDTRETGIYVDAPWPDDGDRYKHKFSEGDQRRLAAKLARFERARVVIRFGDHPLIRELYPEHYERLDCGRGDGLVCEPTVCEIQQGIIPSAGRSCGPRRPLGNGWTWIPVKGRTQTNEAKREVLIVNGPSRAGGGMFQ